VFDLFAVIPAEKEHDMRTLSFAQYLSLTALQIIDNGIVGLAAISAIS
jgi:hypothetical protein